MNPTVKPVVYLVDDDVSVLKTVTRLLQCYGLDVRPYASARAFLEHYEGEHGCLVLDLSMPDIDGLQLQTELQTLDIHIPIIFITGHGEIPDSVQAIRAGAVDFLLKPFRTEQLLESITNAVQQDLENRESLQKLDDKKQRVSKLTDRQTEIFNMLIGSTVIPSSKVIARMLDISHRTVEHHRSSILEKTGVRSVQELRVTFNHLYNDNLSVSNTSAFG